MAGRAGPQPGRHQSRPRLAQVPRTASTAATTVPSRLYQLGLDARYFSGGVRPHLAVFYQAVRERPSLVAATGWREQVPASEHGG